MNRRRPKTSRKPQRTTQDQARPKGSFRDARSEGYLAASRRPLYALILILPLAAAFELGSLLYLGVGAADGTPVQTVSAYRLLGRLFETFGAAGYYLPALVVLATLLVWHMIRQDPWHLRPGYLVAMAIEATAWALPLLGLAAIIGAAHAAAITPTPSPTSTGLPPDLADWPLGARLTIAIGAGLYEEFLFRLVLIEVVVVLARDLFRLSATRARIIAVIASAILFTVYHQPSGPDVATAIITYGALGVVLAYLYAYRGFGIAVGAHAVYDIAVLALLNP